jgi:hypothetical protein
MKWQVNKMSNQYIVELTKWQIDEMARRQKVKLNGKSMEWQVDAMTYYQGFFHFNFKN